MKVEKEEEDEDEAAQVITIIEVITGEELDILSTNKNLHSFDTMLTFTL